MENKDILSDQELIRLIIDPMPIEEFKEWINIPCSIDALYACYDHYEQLPQTTINLEKLMLIDDLLMERIFQEVPHRVSDR